MSDRNDMTEQDDTERTEDGGLSGTVSPELPADPEEAAEAAKTEKRGSFVLTLFEYLEILVFSVSAVLLVFTLCIRLCRVDGSSMLTTLKNGEMLITTSLVTPEPGDIIVFHMTSTVNDHFNEPLVKRIIAKGGQTVRIDYNTSTVYVDGVQVDEPYASFLNSRGQDIGVLTQLPAHHFDRYTGIFEAEVPEGYLFVMGDNRNNSADSRTVEVGFVDERRVLGKVICRLSPFTVFD